MDRVNTAAEHSLLTIKQINTAELSPSSVVQAHEIQSLSSDHQQLVDTGAEVSKQKNEEKFDFVLQELHNMNKSLEKVENGLENLAQMDKRMQDMEKDIKSLYQRSIITATNEPKGLVRIEKREEDMEKEIKSLIQNSIAASTIERNTGIARLENRIENMGKNIKSIIQRSLADTTVVRNDNSTAEKRIEKMEKSIEYLTQQSASIANNNTSPALEPAAPKLDQHPANIAHNNASTTAQSAAPVPAPVVNLNPHSSPFMSSAPTPAHTTYKFINHTSTLPSAASVQQQYSAAVQPTAIPKDSPISKFMLHSSPP